MASLAFSLVAVAAISAWPNLIGLGASRVAQGVAMRLVGASATAFLAETFPGDAAPVRAANHVSAMPALGFGLGGITTALSVASSMTLLPLSYTMHMGACVLVILAWMRLPAGARRRATPVLSLPIFPAGAVPFCVAVCAAWSSVSVVLSIVPLELARRQLTLWSGLTTFLMPLSGLACQQFSRRLAPPNAVRIGLVLAPVGCLVLALGFGAERLDLTLIGAAAAGAVGVGFSFQGCLAPASVLGGAEKARAAAGFFLACYLGLCIAPLPIGWISDRSTTFGALILLTVCLTLVSVSVEIPSRTAGASSLGGASRPYRRV